MIKQNRLDQHLPIIDINTATKTCRKIFRQLIRSAATTKSSRRPFSRADELWRNAALIDLALNRPVTASSTAGTNVAAFAVDQDFSTQWSSAATDNEWIYVQPGFGHEYLAVCLRWGAAYGQSYKIVTTTPRAGLIFTRTTPAVRRN